MKKTFILFAAVLLSSMAMAQSFVHYKENGLKLNFRLAEAMAFKGTNHTHFMSSQYADDFQQVFFSYDNQGRLVAVTDEVFNDYKVTDSLYYNAQGQLIKLSGFQYFLDTHVEKNVYYIDYTYDNAGNLATRTNYNLFGGAWNLGGTYYYTYNSDHQITLSRLEMLNITYQKVSYSYVDGKLKREVWSQYNGAGCEPNEVYNYNYTDGLLTLVLDSVVDDNGSWAYNGRDEYSYDEDGNVLQYSAFNAWNRETERRVYEYSNLELENVLVPWTPEQDRPFFYTNKHAYISEEYWTIDTENRIQHFCDFYYTYTPMGQVGIENADAPIVAVFPNPTTDNVRIQGIDKPVSMTIVDMSGRLVMAGRLAGEATISLSSFANGIYVLTLSDGRQAKIVKQ